MAQYFKNFIRSEGFSCSEEDSQGKGTRIKVRGEGCYDFLKHESGVHKVIRVPETEARGRLHSSTIVLLVLPDVPFTFNLEEKDLKYEFTTAQGPGGQHVNKTESACKITHVPTGITAINQETRCQHQNKLSAQKNIREKVSFAFFILFFDDLF